MYVAPGVPLVTAPVVAFRIAPSPGSGLNVNVPPVDPIMVAVPPSQVAVILKDASPVVRTVTVCVLLAGQTPAVVYSIV